MKAAPPAAPFADRLAVAYLAAPLVIWLLGWFEPVAGLPAAALLVAGLWGPLSGSWRVPKPSRIVVAAALAALAVTLVSPAGGFLLVRPDWETHRAVFLDLAQGGWPTYLAGPLDDEPLLLRYYLGWPMAPALAARAAGIASLNWTVPLWTWFGTSLAAVLFVRRFPTVRAAALALAVLFLFSGADLADILLRTAIERIAQSPPAEALLEYQPSLETLRLSPQHFIPAALGSLLLIRARGRPHCLSMAAAVLAASLFWSPFVAAGLAPLAAVAVAGPGRRLRPLGWTGALATVPAVALTALYFAGGDVGLPRAWLWESWDGSWSLAFRLAAFYATEFLVLAWLVGRTDGRTSREPFLLAAVGVLLVAPLYRYGTLLNPYSDWSVRFSAPAVLVLSYYAARAVATRLPEMAGGHGHLRSRAAWWALVALLVVGAGPVLRDFRDSRWRPLAYQRTDESISLDVGWEGVRQRIAPHPPAPLVAALKSPGPERRKPMALLIRSGYDAYLDGEARLVYAKRDCDWEAENRSWLFLEVRYAPSAGLPAPGLRRPAWDEWELSAASGREERLRLRLRWFDHYGEGRGCTVVARFGGVPVESIRTGQYGPGGRLLWAVERDVSGGVLAARSGPAAPSR